MWSTSIVLILLLETEKLPFLNRRKVGNDRRIYFISTPWKNVANLAGVKPPTSWSPVGCIQLSHRGWQSGQNVQMTKEDIFDEIFMQMVSLDDIFHEMLTAVFWEK